MTFLDDCADQQFDTMSEETHLTPGHLDAFQLVDIDIADRIVPLPSVPQRRFEPDRASIGKDLPLAKFWTREGDETGLYFTGINIAGWSSALWIKEFTAHALGVFRVQLKVRAGTNDRSGRRAAASRILCLQSRQLRFAEACRAD